MDEQEQRNLMDVYGLNPNTLPHALNFPKLPPGITAPKFQDQQNLIKEKMIHDAKSMSSRLDDYRRMYQKYASGLVEMSFPGLVPPFHPFYSNKNNIETLQKEKQKLEKENFELKKQLEDLLKENKKI